MDLLITNAQLRGREGTFDIAIDVGRITAIGAALEAPPETERIDAGGGLVSSAFVEPHFHLDKTLSRDRFGATSPSEAFARARDVKRHFTVEDVEARASHALRLAVAHGIGRLRAQCDVDFATKLVSFEGLLRARDRFAGLIDVEIVAFPQEGIMTDREAPTLLREALRMGADAVGGLPEFELSKEDQDRHIDTIFEIAEEFGVPIDVHVDYMDVPELKTLEKLADRTIEQSYAGRVVAGHCSALAVYPDDEATRVIEKVRAAEIDVVVMPMGNLQMLGGDRRTPYNRGSSRLKELLNAGVNVAAATDNMYDIWYRFSRMDPVELGLITALSAGMRTDEEVETAFDMITTRAARVLRAPDRGISEGELADLVIFESANIVDVLRNLPGRRTTLKAGRPVGGLWGQLWMADP